MNLFGEQQDTWETLKKAILSKSRPCIKCELYKEKQVLWAGDPTYGIIFVGEAPGIDEVEKGIPFIGRSGQLLRKNLAIVFPHMKEPYVTNVVKCFPPPTVGGKQQGTPTKNCTKQCSVWLVKELNLIAREKRVLVVAIGGTATSTLLGKKVARVSDFILTIGTGITGLPVMTIWHPAYVIRNMSKANEFIEQLKTVKRYALEHNYITK